jgi:hypothetical protein
MKWTIISANGLLTERLNFAPFVLNSERELEEPESILTESIGEFLTLLYVLDSLD